MISEYICENCFLAFSLGWSHDDMSGGSGTHLSSTSFVCTACGTSHYIEWAFFVDYSNEMTRKMVADGLAPEHQHPDLLYTRGKPVFGKIENEVVIKPTSIRGAKTLEMHMPRSHESPQLHWDNGVGYPIKALADLPCGFCESIGNLVDEWPDKGAACPHCSRQIEEPIAKWMN